MNKNTDIATLLNRIDYLEENRRFIRNALEMALSLGDFQEKIRRKYNPDLIFQEAEKRIRLLIPFEAQAFYFVDQDNSDLFLSICEPLDFKQFVIDEMEFLIDKGFMAWAMHERRGVFIASKDHKRKMLLHVIATHSRIRGMFMGFFPVERKIIPDASQVLLSIILLNVANALESAEFYNLMEHQNVALKNKVNERTKELALYEKQLQLARKMEAIGILAGGVAHDLNNILSGIVSYPELLLMDIPEKSPLKKPILTIKKSGERAAAIVQDLLTLVRRGVAVSEVVDLNNIIFEYLKSPEYEKLCSFYPDIEVKTNIDASILNIMGSPFHLSKVVMNLVSNSAEAMPEGGQIIISTENRHVDMDMKGFEDFKGGDYSVILISDNGTGISPEDLERIFEPFYTKKKMGRSGTGLGMAVVWGTVKDHNGHIDIKSIQGKGTTITLYFPSTRKEIHQPQSSLSINEYLGRGESILVVDDVEDQREIASEMLRKLNYSVASVSSGEEAVDYLKKNKAELLVLDMIMDPGIDGLDTYKKILEVNPHQRAIIASGFSETERIKKTLQLGAGAYVKKPYLLEKIGLAVKSALER